MQNIYSALVDIQYKIVKRLKRQIYNVYEGENKKLKSYYKEFKKQIPNKYNLTSKKELIECCSSSDVLLIGDFHTLRNSQISTMKMIDNVIKNDYFKFSNKKVIIGMEMFMQEHQDVLNSFLKDEITKEKLLNLVNYESTWGFDWDNYFNIISYAKENNIPVIALNTKSDKKNNSLKLRDKEASKKIIKTIKEYPNTLVAVLFGELHLAKSHLPYQLQKYAKINNINLNCVVVHQNIDKIYWDLASKQMENITSVVKFNHNEFCLINTAPLVKYQSWLNWNENYPELRCRINSKWCEENESEIDYTPYISQFINIYCEFLGLPIPDLSNLQVISIDNPDINNVLSGLLTPDKIPIVKNLLLRNESYFIKESDVLLLTNISVNHAAEEAAHYLYSKLNYSRYTAKLNKIDYFYNRIIEEAIAYLASKIINNKRKCYTLKDYELFILHNLDKKVRDPRIKELRKIAKYVLKHKENERIFVTYNEWLPTHYISKLKMEVKISLTHALGYMLGEKLYSGLLQNAITKDEIKELFVKQYKKKGNSLTEYLNWIKRLFNIRDFYESKVESI